MMRTSFAPLAAGAILLLAGCSAPDAPDPTPRLDRTDVVGAWGAAPREGVGIDFSEDGRFDAHDVCSLSGDWSEADGRVELLVLEGTGMACSEVPNLEQMREAEVRGGTLTLLDDEGGELVRLERRGG